MAENDLPIAVRFLHSLSTEGRDNLAKAFEQAKPAISLIALARRIARDTGFGEKEIEAVCFSMAGWYELSNRNDSALDQVLDYILQQGAIEPPLPPDDPDSLSVRDTVRRLLQCEESIGISSKAFDVLSRHQRQFIDAQTVTELRPIFYADTGNSPANAVILHELKIRYREAGQEQVIFIALDRYGLISLYEVLERAWKKEESLRGKPAYNLLGAE